MSTARALQISTRGGLLASPRNTAAGLPVAAGVLSAAALCTLRDTKAEGEARRQNPITTSRVMLPDDANLAGNVHGGTILRMVDEAGYIASMRHANSECTGKPTYAAMARIEKMDFVSPMYIGELATLEAKVTFASDHSCEVIVDVYGENLTTGARRLTNRARLWYVAVDSVETTAERVFHVTAIPPLPLDDAEAAAGQRRFQAQKANRRRRAEADAEAAAARAGGEADGGGAATSLVQLMLPGDVNGAGFAQAGVVLKLMDNAAGIAAYRHCKTNVVTATLDALDFKRPVQRGSVVRIDARPIFASSRSLEVEVVVEAESTAGGGSAEAVRGYLTFVSLDERGRPLPIAPLPPPATPAEAESRAAGKARYEARKLARQAAKAKEKAPK